jgi:hypothetical protein
LNSPVGYQTFYNNYGNSPYAQVALKLEAQPKLIPLMQATKFLAPQNIAPTLKIGNLGQPKYMPLIQQGHGGSLMNANLPVVQKPVDTISKIVTLPAPTNTTTNTGGIGKIVTLPVTNTTPSTGNNNTGTAGKIVSMPVNVGKAGATVDVKTTDVKTTNVQTQNQPIRVNNGVVKLNNNPVNKVQVQNNVQNTRPQFNATGNGGGNNFRQSMNQSPVMNGGNNHRNFMH